MYATTENTKAPASANLFSTIAGLWRAVMKHWRPELEATPRGPAERRKRRHDWSSVLSYVPPRARPQAAHEHRPATMVGLALVAATCIVLGIGAYTLLAPLHAVDRSVSVSK